ncbi:MAG: fructosamine kinase family protein [Candidatus Promineifilaceae bacterium]
MTTSLTQTVSSLLGQPVTDVSPLSGGCIGQVYRVQLADGRPFVVKADDASQPKLDIEGKMLQYLAEHSPLPVPQVIHNAPNLLIMIFLPGQSHFSAEAQHHAAELLAALHNVSAKTFGLEWDTLIGGLHQPNSPTVSWLDFFAQHRLLYMAKEGARVGRLPKVFLPRVEKLAARLDRWLVEPERPSLIHGDVWTTNVLAQNGRITGFIDPAIYYADPEIELAFTTLFGTFGRPFFERYHQLRPIRDGFFEERRDLYNLYPLLVHVRLFGGSYVRSVDSTLSRFGC